MRHITFTNIDAVTGIPTGRLDDAGRLVPNEPARNGPDTPKGARFGFGILSEGPKEPALMYGTILAADDHTEPGILSVITKAEYDAAEAAEMEARADKVRVKVVSMRQARLALLAAEILDDAEAAIAGMEGSEGRAAQIEWEYATELRREHPLVQALGQKLGLDRAAVDALFAQAALIA